MLGYAGAKIQVVQEKSKETMTKEALASIEKRIADEGVRFEKSLADHKTEEAKRVADLQASLAKVETQIEEAQTLYNLKVKVRQQTLTDLDAKIAEARAQLDALIEEFGATNKQYQLKYKAWDAGTIKTNARANDLDMRECAHTADVKAFGAAQKKINEHSKDIRIRADLRFSAAIRREEAAIVSQGKLDGLLTQHEHVAAAIKDVAEKQLAEEARLKDWNAKLSIAHADKLVLAAKEARLEKTERTLAALDLDLRNKQTLQDEEKMRLIVLDKALARKEADVKQGQNVLREAMRHG